MYENFDNDENTWNREIDQYFIWLQGKYFSFFSRRTAGEFFI